MRVSDGGRDAISIHALREEGDIRSHFLHPPIFDFYPRPPRGGRLNHRLNYRQETVFLSTPSARRATQRSSRSCVNSSNFYPRPPRGGRLVFFSFSQSLTQYFYPRPPRGGRLYARLEYFFD